MPKRALAGATIGFTADISGILALAFVPQNIPSNFGHAIYELEILLNIFCLFYTYSSWKDIVFPCRNQRLRANPL